VCHNSKRRREIRTQRRGNAEDNEEKEGLKDVFGFRGEE
jgi:hypothetical protein